MIVGEMLADSGDFDGLGRYIETVLANRVSSIQKNRIFVVKKMELIFCFWKDEFA